MTRDKILKIIADHEPYARYCNKLCDGSDVRNDLYQEFFVFMAEKSEADLVKIYLSGYLENYCLSVIWNKRRETNRFMGGKDGNPLLMISNTHSEIRNTSAKQASHVSQVERNFDRLFNYLNSDQSLKQEDVAVLLESVDTKLIDISRQSGVPYITLKVKQKKLKNKIKQHVKI